MSAVKDQQKPRPKIEDVISDLLTGDRLDNALDFITFLNQMNLPPRGTATNAWTAKYKGNIICTVSNHRNSFTLNYTWYYLQVKKQLETFVKRLQ